MAIQFKKATKSAAKLRLALNGPAGSGKTYTSLQLAKHLGGRVAVVDTEHGSASKYAHLFDFDVVELDNFAPRNFVDAIHAAEAAGYAVVVLDSITHAWNGAGGVMDIVDAAAARAKGNSYAGWKEGTPAHNDLINAIVQSRCHIIATMRAKTEYALERDERTGRTVPKKIGMAPVQRDGMEYEFDVSGFLDLDNTLVIDKTRCPALRQAVIKSPGEHLAKTLLAWLSDGSPAAPAPQPVTPPPPALVEAVRQTPPDAPLVVPTAPEQATPSGPEQVAAGLVDMIGKAQTIAALESQVLPQIQAAKLVDAPRKTVADAYAARRRALNGVRS